jgi:hypothetical protein
MTDETRELIERLDEAKRELEELQENEKPQAEQAQAEDVQDPKVAFATAYRNALNASRSPWISLDVGGDPDVA